MHCRCQRMKRRSLHLSVFLLIWFALLRSVRTEPREESEKRLIYHLFEKNGYNPLIRPVVNSNDSLNILFSLALSQIINVDEVNHLMKTNVWLQVYWQDFQLKWDPSLYENINSIKITPEKVWIPDLVLFNNAEGNFEVTYKSNCVLYSDSWVNWIPPAIYHSSCSIDVMYFPFDQQICEMKFGSWTHKGKALKYAFYKNMDKLDLVNYLKSGTWDLIDCPGKIITHIDEVTGDEKEQIVFRFVLRRKTLFYTVNLITPCVLISFVTCCVFALPADGGEKMSLCSSNSVALVWFLLLVSKILPPALTTPLIAKYLLFTFMMNLFAILSTVVIINRNYRTPRTHKMPYWVRVVFLRELPRCLLMKRPGHDERWQESPSTRTPTVSIQSSPEVHRVNLNVSGDIVELSRVAGAGPEYQASSSGCGPEDGSADCAGSSTYQDEQSSSADHLDREEEPGLEMTPELRQTVDSIKFIYHHLKDEEEYETIREDWKYVARVLDRLLLLIFLLVTLSGTAGILLNAPHILEFVDQDKIIKEIVDYIREAEATAS